MNDDGKPVTRRRFLEMVGAAGGAAAVYETMVAMGLIAVPDAFAGPPDTSGEPGKNQTVIVLGAGVGGLTAALRLKQAGYAVIVCEASDRIGGRNFTVSTKGTDKRNVIVQNGKPRQECKFDGNPETQYFEAGCGRIPYHHVALLELCRELGVALEPYIMETRANRFQTNASFGGASIANRRIANDTRGYVAELLAKAINKRCLDDTLSEADRTALLSLLETFGEVSAKNQYRYLGSTRSGYEQDPGVVSPGKPEKKLELSDILKSAFWKHRFYQAEDYLWQTTLFHPVGGMRKIVDALLAKVGAPFVRTGHAATKIVNGRDGVAVTFANGQTIRANWCVSTVPLPIVSPMLDAATFSADYRKAAGVVKFANTCKVGWQATSRFWEVLRGPNDTNGPQIFGGISWIDHPITQMWYPSAGYFSPGPAVLTGAYNYDSATNPVAKKFGELPLDARLDVGMQGGKLLHPEFEKFVPKDKGLSIAWQEVPFIGGGWAEWDRANTEHAAAYKRLLDPDLRFIAAGDQVSYLPGWMEGAVLSAYHVVAHVMGRVAKRAIEGVPVEAPDSASVTGAG
ncbi:MAG TPA: FAD-dependent oxidoreductase [Tahibacter sp.]|nr:FAD-dependent oxidoreductase [Tahibacter sp.]